VAAVRHEATEYDVLLTGGVPRFEARAIVAGQVEKVLDSWRHPH
jgi:hypothetical protein